MDDLALISAYADAQSALARIEERRRLSPVRRPWKIRCFIAERQALAWIDATSVDASAFTIDGRGSIGGASFDLTHWRQAVGAPVTLDILRTNPNGLLDWLGVNDAPASTSPWATPGLPRADVQHNVEQWQADAAILPPPLPYYKARSWRSHGDDGPRSGGEMAWPAS
ncbi:hypothetical protein [Sphingobium sp. HWE2-09]|uniref:hypothetical protein n=1 Tax=Sphingobium sp. HWE2-09 TaxID=3108390 RepID=UPI002DC7B727|nr:hypothetical protein [Sphingobium sp. HWE2-09]